MPDDMKEVIAAVLETEVDGEEAIAKGLSDKGASAAKGALRLLNAFKDEMPKDILSKLASLAGVKSEEKEPVEKADYLFPEVGNEDVVNKWVDEMPDELKLKIAPVEKSEEGEGEGTEMTDEMKAIQKAHDEQIAVLQKQLNDETAKREIAEWVSKAEKELSHYPGKSAVELGTMLKTLNDTNPEMAESLFADMKSASEALKNSEILKSAGAGKTGDQGNSAWDKIQKMAEGLVKKSEAGMTKAQAIAAVLDTDEGKKLYDQYAEENPKQFS